MEPLALVPAPQSSLPDQSKLYQLMADDKDKLQSLLTTKAAATSAELSTIKLTLREFKDTIEALTLRLITAEQEVKKVRSDLDQDRAGSVQFSNKDQDWKVASSSAMDKISSQHLKTLSQAEASAAKIRILEEKMSRAPLNPPKEPPFKVKMANHIQRSALQEKLVEDSPESTSALSLLLSAIAEDVDATRLKTPYDLDALLMAVDKKAKAIINLTKDGDFVAFRTLAAGIIKSLCGIGQDHEAAKRQKTGSCQISQPGPPPSHQGPPGGLSPQHNRPNGMRGGYSSPPPYNSNQGKGARGSSRG